MSNNFWMIICNEANFRITKDLGFTVQGLKAEHRRKMQRIAGGDRILFYISGARRFPATVTATSSYFEDATPIWAKEGDADWPYRIRIKPDVVLDDSQYINANLLAPRLDYIKRWPPEDWYMAFQGNLHLLPKNDFIIIEGEMKKLKFGRDYDRRSEGQPQAPARRRRRRGPERAGPLPQRPPVAPPGPAQTQPPIV